MWGRGMSEEIDDPTAQHERQEVKLQTDEVIELEGV